MMSQTDTYYVQDTFDDVLMVRCWRCGRVWEVPVGTPRYLWWCLSEPHDDDQTATKQRLEERASSNPDTRGHRRGAWSRVQSGHFRFSKVRHRTPDR
jgi:hypothetical protein